MSVAGEDEDLVAAYKRLLREVLERRPSGMRQRLAEALGTTRSFVSQITNPSYATPIPAACLGTIFDVCHFSEGERARFAAAYRRAHPRKAGLEEPAESVRTLTLTVPDLGSDERNAAFDAALAAMADTIARLVEARDK